MSRAGGIPAVHGREDVNFAMHSGGPMADRAAREVFPGPEVQTDEELSALRVIDASAFQALTTFNPMVAVLMLAERGAELVRGDAR